MKFTLYRVTTFLVPKSPAHAAGRVPWKNSREGMKGILFQPLRRLEACLIPNNRFLKERKLKSLP